jgi:NTE family protein
MGAKHVTVIRVLSSNSQTQTPLSLISSLNRYIDIASDTHTDLLLKKHADRIIDIDVLNVGRFDPKSLTTVIQLGKIEAKKVLENEKDRESNENIIYMEKWLKRSSI